MEVGKSWYCLQKSAVNFKGGLFIYEVTFGLTEVGLLKCLPLKMRPIFRVRTLRRPTFVNRSKAQIGQLLQSHIYS